MEPNREVRPKSPTCYIKAGGKTYELNWSNTTVLCFPNDAWLDRAYVTYKLNEQVLRRAIFGEEMVDELISKNFPTFIIPVPSDKEFNEYIALQMKASIGKDVMEVFWEEQGGQEDT